MADLVQASGQQVVGIFPLWAQTEAQTSGLRPSLSCCSVSMQTEAPTSGLRPSLSCCSVSVQTEAVTSGLRPSLSWWSVSVSVRVNAPDVHDAHEWNIQPAFCMYVCYRINWCVSSGL